MVFLSHAREDIALLRPFAAALEGAGWTVWLDRDSATPGHVLSRELARGIEAARLLVVFLSPRSARSTWVLREVAYARTCGCPILPVLLEPTEPSGPLAFELAHLLRLELPGLSPVDQRSALCEAARARTAPSAATVHQGAPGPWPRIPTRTWHRGLSPPGALLRAELGVVPFHGRVGELAELVEWADAPPRVAVRLCTGPGGAGKTRLAIELCGRLRAQGWHAGFVSREQPAELARRVDRSRAAGARLLLVIDYASSSLDAVAAVLNAMAPTGRQRHRVLLLARSGGEWWERLKARRDLAGELASGPAASRVRLGPLATTPDERRQSYTLACARFADQLGRPLPTAPAGGSDAPIPDVDRVLLLHIAALAHLEGERLADEDGVLDHLLRRERRHWRDRCRDAGQEDLLVRGMGQVLAVLTLRGGAISAREALQVAARVPALADQGLVWRHAVVRLLHELYPAEDAWMEPLLPDLLGEHLVQSELTDPVSGDALMDLVFAGTDPAA